jgi:hypothetical protein
MTDQSMTSIFRAVVVACLLMLSFSIYRYLDDHQHCIQWQPYDREVVECSWTESTDICTQGKIKKVHDTRCIRRDDQ